ncbi:MAG: 50S ribosomal protein L24 [Acidobacteria bacterium]|nr:50S ribosomal protein L24 [Acidobacteriota bacterium]
MSLHVRKDDMVLVIAGKRGKERPRGKVLRVYPAKMRAIVEGVNFIKKHTKPNPSKNIKGGIVEREAPIHVSNLMVICPECSKPVRVARKMLEDGKRHRVCRKCQGMLDRK